MTALLSVIACGAGTSLQDFGRTGYRRFGVATAGAMDRMSLARANLLVGNPIDACGVELVLGGGRFRIEGAPVAVAIGSDAARLSIAGQVLPPWSSGVAQPGDTIEVSAPVTGIYVHLAVSGGIAVEAEMGSRSMHRRSAIGGSGLAPGALLPVGPAPAPRALRGSVSAPRQAGTATIRVVRGPQDDLFPADSWGRFIAAPYVVDPRSDRMGYRLLGNRLFDEPIAGMVSDGVVPGSIQVPGEGTPIVLMRDCQTTGGYPKIATVISADLDRLAQCRPGEAIRFEEVSLDEAIGILRAAVREIAGFGESLRAADAMPDAEDLLALNLAGDAVHAHDFSI